MRCRSSRRDRAYTQKRLGDLNQRHPATSASTQLPASGCLPAGVLLQRLLPARFAQLDLNSGDGVQPMLLDDLLGSSEEESPVLLDPHLRVQGLLPDAPPPQVK